MSECSDALNVGCSLGESSEDSTDIGTLLHGDDSELVFLVDPDEEGLLVVVEDASAFWPVSVEVAGIEEAVTLFEEEMIVDKLLLLLWSHGPKRVEGSGKFALERVASLDNSLLDLISLLSGDGWAERELCQISADSDACRSDHSCVFRGEGWALELRVVHVAHVSP